MVSKVALAASGGALETEPLYWCGPIDPCQPALQRGSQGRLCVDSHVADVAFC